ncbi:radical SAM protein [Candidatus Woesearchaeota archaeon]|nr:radical SAM protein [Candidatus Woesearchaeota archaeon]
MLTLMYTQALNVCKLAKKVNSKTYTVIGGPHPTIAASATLQHEKEIDFAVIGEAEITFLQLLEAMDGKRNLSDVDGIAYKTKTGEVRLTKPREVIEDLDIMPIPDRSLLKMHLYRPSVSYYKRLPAYIILTTRGCPYRCTFCSKVFDKKYRQNSVARVIEEMEILIEQFGAKEIVFRDDTFTMRWPWINEFCNKVIEKGLYKKARWSCMTRVNLINLDMLKLMKKAGCWGIHFGVESGNQRLLDLIKKDTTVQQIRDAFKWCKEAGIETRAFMMLGLPTETKEESLQTIQFAKELDPDWAQFTITTPYPGTELYEQANQFGELKSIDWDNYQTWAGFSDHNLVWVPKGRNSQELKELQRKALKEFYFRPKFIFKKLIHIDNFAIFKKYVLGAWAILTTGEGRAVSD